VPEVIVRIFATAEAWLAAFRDDSRFGIAIAAMIRMIATTISSSIKEKPRSLGPDRFDLRLDFIVFS
jgi:hypothetical protein